MPQRHTTLARRLFLAVASLGLATPAQVACAQDSNQFPSLRETVGDRLLIGAAVGRRQLDDPAYAALVSTHYNSIVAGNEMKPDSLQREKGRFTFERADEIVAFAEKHNQQVVGHTLVWHSQAPRWLFEDESGKPLSRDEALANLRTHIETVLNHFRGRIVGWDVVNEAISDAPNEYLRDTPARRAIGDDYVIQAFRIAHEVDPNVELYYNDYNIEADYKRPKAMRLIRELQAAGVRLDAIGVQGHWLLRHPELSEIERGLTELASTGVPLMITELDIDPLPRRGAGADVNATEQQADPYKDGLPPEVQQELADRYRAVFDLLVRYANEGTVKRVTLWGVHDNSTWLNDFPVRGRTNHPLLFDRAYQPKPAFFAVRESLGALHAPAMP